MVDGKTKISIAIIGAALPTFVWCIFWVSGLSFKVEAHDKFKTEQEVTNKQVLDSLARIETKLGIVKEKK